MPLKSGDGVYDDAFQGNSKFWILDFGFWILDFGFWI